MAKITTIFTKGDSLLNYDLQCFLKNLGKPMYNELYIHLVEHSVLYSVQFGLVFEIVVILDEITNGFMEIKYTIGVFADLSEGFYTVNQ